MSNLSAASLHEIEQQSPLVLDFLTALSETGFNGEIDNSTTQRLVHATDNSIYQVVPHAIISPKSESDIIHCLTLANSEAFRNLSLFPRGGGTGTNGQSLGEGIVIDCSKYLTNIIEIDTKSRLVTVEPGVRLSELNQALAEHGFQFAPTVAPANRATIGGMIATDASGKGSRIHGKTSDHIQALTLILPDGRTWQLSNDLDSESLKQHPFYPELVAIKKRSEAEISKVFPSLNRGLTGYNLKKAFETSINPIYLVAGAEGSLGIVSQATLNISPIPKQRKLIVASFFNTATAAAQTPQLLSHNPFAIELMDHLLIELATSSDQYATLFPPDVTSSAAKTKARPCVLYIELIQDTESALMAQTKAISEYLSSLPLCLDQKHVSDPSEIKRYFSCRSEAVGLCSLLPGKAKPVAFIEDTVVPPHCLPDFLRELGKILNSYSLTFALYGHADVGCVHVRPAVDLSELSQRQLIPIITEKVLSLSKKYGGLLWGEHAKGFRSEYTQELFGDPLYKELQKIKSLFDPRNQLAPGNIVSTPHSQIQTKQVDSLMRGHFNQDIDPRQYSRFYTLFNCNGNGACFSLEKSSVMCPSYQVTLNRVQSPKGRSDVLREWLRYKRPTPIHPLSASLKKVWHTLSLSRPSQFDREVLETFESCLSCHGCSDQCPTRVSIPYAKSLFFRDYYNRFLRPLKDHLVGKIESKIAVLGAMPSLSNAFTHNVLSRWLLKNIIGLQHLPKLSEKRLRRSFYQNTEQFLVQNDYPKNSVVIFPDAFSLYYNPELLEATVSVLQHYGCHVLHLPYMPSGKAASTKGFLDLAETQTLKWIPHLESIQEKNLSILCLDPSLRYFFRKEFPVLTGNSSFSPLFVSLEDFLLTQKLSIQSVQHSQDYVLLSHCMESTQLPSPSKKWETIFEKIGLSLSSNANGCCGMAGSFGLEKKQESLSQRIFERCYEQVTRNNRGSTILATGYSCRTQLSLYTKDSYMHPVEVIHKHLS